MKHRLLLVLACAMVAAMSADPVYAQAGFLPVHGSGAPSTLNPVPNCALHQIYNDDLTGTVWAASRTAGYPCGWAVVSGGGGAPAGSNGNPQINASGSSFGAAANVFYQQSGDTIASIETMCSSLCTYVVTSPQTITLAANHTLSANVFVQFEANGIWTVNGSGFTLSGIQVGGATTSTHFALAGTGSVALSAYNSQVPVEWFGAVGDWNGTTGTDNLAAIQATINAITYGQFELQSRLYAIGGTLTITKSNVGAFGPLIRGGFVVGAQPVSGLVETIAGDDALDVHGSGTSNYLWNGKFKDFSISSSVTQTGTAAGFSSSFTAGMLAQEIEVQDFFYPFYIHASPSSSAGGFYRNTAYWTSLSSGLTSPACYYFDSADGIGEASLTMRDDQCAQGAGPSSSKGAELIGNALQDVDFFNFNVAGVGYPIYIDWTGSGSFQKNSDIHFHTPTLDGCLTSCLYVTGLTEAEDGSVDISGGWMRAANTLSGFIVDIESSYGVSIKGTQITSIGGWLAQGIRANSSSGLILANNTITNPGTYGMVLNSLTNSSITGNTINSTSADTMLGDIWVEGTSTRNTFSGNAIGGYSAVGINFVSSSVTNNQFLDYGSIDPTHITTPVSDAGTNNGGSFNKVATPVLALTSATQPTCSSTTAGQFNYVQGNSTTKDTVSVCAHDASNAYAWRTIY